MGWNGVRNIEDPLGHYSMATTCLPSAPTSGQILGLFQAPPCKADLKLISLVTTALCNAAESVQLGFAAMVRYFATPICTALAWLIEKQPLFKPRPGAKLPHSSGSMVISKTLRGTRRISHSKIPITKTLASGKYRMMPMSCSAARKWLRSS